jgi:hypothetical protein
VDGLEIPAMLNKNKDSIPLHVLNTGGKTITIAKGTKLGSVTEAAEMVEEDKDKVPSISRVINLKQDDSARSKKPGLSSTKDNLPVHLIFRLFFPRMT